AIPVERLDGASDRALGGGAQGPGNRDADRDSLVKGSLAVFLGTQVGLGGPCSDFPAVGEFAGQGDRGAIVSGEVAADVGLADDASSELVIGGKMAGGDLIVEELEGVFVVALADPVDLGPQCQARIHRLP